METITVNGKTYYAGQENKDSFLTVGEIYCFRTVTMIYTGRLLAINDKEFLIDEAAWIPETERWFNFLKEGKAKEVEPYVSSVVLNRGATLDVTAFPKLFKEQK